MAASESSETEGQDAESVEDLGLKLRIAREAQELALEEIAAELRIGAHLLSALEEGRFDDLGAPVFAKGYLKQYAARLGLDVAELVADYELSAANRSVDIAPSRTIRLRDERQITIWVGAGFALFLMAAVLWVWWWLGSTDDVTPLSVDTVVDTEPAPLDTSPPPPDTELFIEPEAVADIDTEPPVSLDTEPAVSLDTEPVPESEAFVAASEADPIDGPQLDILFVADSWTEITTESGERLYYDLGRAGSRASVPADRGLNLFFGNAGGVELSINGQPIVIPASARRGNLAQFDLDALVDIAELAEADGGANE